MSGAEEWSGAERIVRCMSEPGISEYESQVLAKSQVLEKKRSGEGQVLGSLCRWCLVAETPRLEPEALDWRQL